MPYPDAILPVHWSYSQICKSTRLNLTGFSGMARHLPFNPLEIHWGLSDYDSFPHSDQATPSCSLVPQASGA